MSDSSSLELPIEEESRSDDSGVDNDNDEWDFDHRGDVPASLGGRLVSNLAVLGDSGTSLTVSFALLLISIGVSVWLNNGGAPVQVLVVQKEANGSGYPDYQTYSSLGRIPSISPPHIFEYGDSVTSEMRQAYEKDGVVCVRGLIDANLLQQLDADSSVLVNEQREKDAGKRRQGTQFYAMAHSAIFRTNWTVPQTKESPSALLRVALWSSVPAFAASLLFHPPIDNSIQPPDSNKLHLIRDIFLAKDNDKYVCGWHVDDMGFWPATPQSPGINAWIALDDMEVTEETGGFALAVQSHQAPWREAAYYWTGASTNFPRDGYANASDMIARRTGQGTCNLERAAPHLHQRMEETARIYPVKRGDVIFHTRWLFHRTVAVNRTTASHPVCYRRYSLRYGPGSSIVPPGFGTELSVLWNASNGGRSVEEIEEEPWYPRAWPSLEVESELDSFWEGMSRLTGEILPVAEQRRDRRIREMKPLLRRLAKTGGY